MNKQMSSYVPVSLVCLPRELLLEISESLPLSDLNSLVQVCRHIYDSLNSVLYYFGHNPDSHPYGFCISGPVIFLAVTIGSVGAVRRFVKEFGADVNEWQSDTTLATPLHCAAGRRHPAVVKFLLENGASILLKDSFQTTVLQRAVQSDNCETVEYVLEYGPEPLDLVEAVGQISNYPITAPIMSRLRNHVLEKSQQEFRNTPGSEVAMYRLLLHAVGVGDKDGVKAILDWGIPANFLPCRREDQSVLVFSKDGRSFDIRNDRAGRNMMISALFYAVYTDHLEIARLLYDHGAPVEDGDSILPVLFAAVGTRNSAALQLMVEWKASPLARTMGQGWTSLHVAAGAEIYGLPWPGFSGSLEMMKQLINMGVPVDLLDNNGATALQTAVTCRWFPGVRWLLENGANVNALSSISLTTPLYYAVCQGSNDILSILLDYGADVSTAENRGLTPLMCRVQTAAHGNKLLELGCDILARDRSGCMGLDYAVSDANLELVQFFLNQGAPVNQFAKGYQPLHIMLQRQDNRNRVAITKLLLSYGAPVNSSCKQSAKPPLQYAIETEDPELVKLLLDNGADLNNFQGPRNSRTVLHYAAFRSTPSIVSLIIDYAAEINPRALKGETPLQLAVEKSRDTVVLMLLKRGAEPNTRVEQGWTPLFCATQAGNLEIMSYLLEYGANPRDTVDGETMLHRATDSCRIDEISLLLKHMDFVDDKMQGGETALHIAAKDDGRRHIAELLVEAGASLDAVNDLGETPLQVAHKMNCPDVAEYLESAGPTQMSSRTDFEPTERI